MTTTTPPSMGEEEEEKRLWCPGHQTNGDEKGKKIHFAGSVSYFVIRFRKSFSFPPLLFTIRRRHRRPHRKWM